MMGLFSSLFGHRESQPEPAPEDPKDLLDSPDGAARVDALRALIEQWRSGDVQAAEAVAPRLTEFLEDPEPLVRATALGGVRLLQKPENLSKCESGVLACLSDPVPGVRKAAIWSALRIPGDTARAQIRAALRSEDESLRFEAARALAELQDAAGMHELLTALRDDHRRQEAMSALMALGDPAALPELVKLFEEESLGEFDRTAAAAALTRLGDARGAAHLVARIESGGDDRPMATEWAGRLGVQEAVPALTEVAEADGDPSQGAAIRALGRLRAPEAEERLSRIAGDANAPDDLRMDAAEGLAELGTPAALALLQQLAGDGVAPEELRQLCQELLVEVQANAG
jgi:HEAT repeat protein